jgi:hypothetical protein
MKESHRKGDSDSILTASFARVVARRHAKRKQRYRWPGRKCVPGVERCASALTLFIQDRSRMRETRSYGSVRGVLGNRHPYRDRIGGLFDGLAGFEKTRFEPPMPPSYWANLCTSASFWFCGAARCQIKANTPVSRSLPGCEFYKPDALGQSGNIFIIPRCQGARIPRAARTAR